MFTQRTIQIGRLVVVLVVGSLLTALSPPTTHVQSAEVDFASGTLSVNQERADFIYLLLVLRH